MAMDQYGNTTPDYASIGDINSLRELIKGYQSNIDANYVKANANGNAVVAGGTNQYGFTRPDQVLMTGTDGKLLEPYKDKLSDSANALKNYGGTIGQSVDSRGSIGMGQSYSTLRDKANASGDMASVAAMRQQANNGTIRDLGKSDMAANTSMANAQSAMAMRGGLGNGSAERMGKSAAQSAMASRQGIIGQNRDQNLNLDIQNENMKNDLLKATGNVEQSNSQYNAGAFNNLNAQKLDALKGAANIEQNISSSNIGTQRADLQQMNLGSFAKFKEDMQAYGATQQANATQAAGGGGGGCFITTACVDVMGMKDDCWALTIARNFRDEYMSQEPERAYELSEYYTLAPSMLVHLKESHDYKRILKRVFWTYIVPFAKLASNDQLEEARAIYKDMMDYLHTILKQG